MTFYRIGMPQTWYNDGTTKRRGAASNSPRHDPQEANPMGSIHSTRRFYVYILARPNGKPFYVGKGSGDRVFMHDTEARAGHACHKCNVIRKIWKSGGEVQRYMMLETDDEQEALAYEVELIALYGRKTLANLTDGGEGVAGYAYKRTPETIEKVRASLQAYYAARPEERARIGERIRADAATPEGRAKRVAARAARSGDPEHQARASAGQIARYARPEERAKASALHKGHTFTPETLERMRASSQARWAKAEERAKASAATKAHFERLKEKVQ
jgi:hypothetical protein